MNPFSRLPEFEKEFSKLAKKYPSLPEDLGRLEKLITDHPIGIGTNFTVIHHNPAARIVKTRLACKSLKKRSMRIIYAHHNDVFEFVYIEIYFKGDKENEDRKRITDYIKRLP